MSGRRTWAATSISWKGRHRRRNRRSTEGWRVVQSRLPTNTAGFEERQHLRAVAHADQRLGRRYLRPTLTGLSLCCNSDARRSRSGLIQSAKLNGHDPYVYLKDILERLPTQPASRIDELLPHRWVPRVGAQHKKSPFFTHLAKADLIVIDDFGLTPLADELLRDLLKIVDDRFDKKSTIVTSQLPVETWHRYLDDPTLADAILERLVHNAYRLDLKGDSMRKKKSL